MSSDEDVLKKRMRLDVDVDVSNEEIEEEAYDESQQQLSNDYDREDRLVIKKDNKDDENDDDDDGNDNDGKQQQIVLSTANDERLERSSSKTDDEDNDDDEHENENDDNKEAHALEQQPQHSSGTGCNTHVVALHYNELKESGRGERLYSRIVHMRNFNNWIKSQLIAEYLSRVKNQQRVGEPIRVLDMCCGKGGDLLKWDKANITHLICTDIAEVSVGQCKRRYEELLSRGGDTKFSKKFTAEFITCDSTLVRLRERYKDPSLKLNLVSCQFSFHYSFESLSQADCMVRNAAECLMPGGYFIATIPDAYEIMRRFKDAGPTSTSNGRSFGNDVYNIEFNCDTNPPPLFGAKYHFHLEGVVDCPEFLVHFPTLMKLCHKHGLKLERKTTIVDYYHETFEKGRTLLQRMSGLETVFGNRSNDEQYAHLQTHTGKHNAGRRFGTLSKAEWEAATLYLVCAFRKCKNTWDAEGKPVFEFD